MRTPEDPASLASPDALADALIGVLVVANGGDDEHEAVIAKARSAWRVDMT